MPEVVEKVPMTNRAYKFAFVALVAMFILTVIVMFQHPNQSLTIYKMLGQKLTYLVLSVVVPKEAGKLRFLKKEEK